MPSGSGHSLGPPGTSEQLGGRQFQVAHREKQEGLMGVGAGSARMGLQLGLMQVSVGPWEVTRTESRREG